ncbi:MFS transporter [Phytohabitans kaempferiae]|uniref:MFS transporter n=1 Tax=Phytohabitans kaempferiae TaxID=1620943 RepID=A0ABV6LYR0_9ACTN
MAAPTAGLRTFVILWCGQFVSLTGSSVSGFALGVYAYQLTGSVTTLGIVYALAYLPVILASPFTGSLVDRWGVQRSLVVSNIGNLVVMLTLAGLLITDTFVTWHIYVLVAVISVIGALQTPAFEASVPLLVPKRHLGRANGMRMVALATSQVMAPVAAGFLLISIGIGGIILVDCASYAVALITLALIRIPRPGGEAAGSPSVASLLADFAVAWRYVVMRRGLLALIYFLGALNFCAGFVDLLFTPLVLAFESSDALGTVLSIGGIGMIAASLAMSAWGGPRHRVNGVLGFSLVLGVATVIGSFRPSVPLVAVGAFLFLGALAIVVGNNLTIWQSKVEPQLLGRTMAMMNMVASAPQLVAYALAGVTADRVFQPLVGRDEVRSPVVAALVGDGPGRGIALLLMVMGVLIVVCVVVGYAHPRLRHLEDELPDVTGEEPSVPAEPAPAQAASTRSAP